MHPRPIAPSTAATLSVEEVAHLATHGYVHLRGAIPTADATKMCDRIWAALEIGQVDRRDPSTWLTVDRHSLAQAGERGDYDAYMSPTVIGVVNQMLGPGAQGAHRWPLPMVTFPRQGADPEGWAVPATGWHLDGSPRMGPAESWLRTFALLAPHHPGGGGTVFIAGSHRLVDAMSDHLSAPRRATPSSVARARLARMHPWFGQLFNGQAVDNRTQHLMTDGAVVDGVHVQVVEFTGDAGDLLVVHPWILHAASPNHRETPRLMLMMAFARAGEPPVSGPAEKGDVR